MHVHVIILLDFPITYWYGSMLCQPEYEGLDQTVNIVVFFTN